MTWGRHVSHRCPHVAAHTRLRNPLPVPCDECWSVESIWQRIPYEPNSSNELPGDAVVVSVGTLRALYDHGYCDADNGMEPAIELGEDHDHDACPLCAQQGDTPWLDLPGIETITTKEGIL